MNHMNRIKKKIVDVAINKSIKSIESEPDTHINLFNTGIVIDLKKLKISALKLIQANLKK
jgi:hypothetical protein